MPYYDRKGSPLTREEWRYRFLDPTYATLRDDAVDLTTRVETYWVGWASVSERVPLIFGTRVITKTDTGWQTQDPHHTATEADALALHEETLRALGDPVASGSRPRERRTK